MTTRREFTRLTAISSLGLALSPGMVNRVFGSERIRIGQIGTGHSHADAKYQTMQKLNHLFDVVGIVENDPEMRKIARTKKEYNNANWITEQELFNTNGLQAILIETDFNDLLPTAQRCIDAGFHAHVDKPPGNSLSGFKSLLEQAAFHNLTLQMGYMYRYHPAFQFCIQTVKDGMIGDIFEVHGVISKKINQQRRKRLAATYGGSMMLLGCHLIDILVAVCGHPVSISSYRKQTYLEQDSLFDNELVVFDYPRTTATIRSALLEVEGMRRRQFIVCGDKGTIQIQPLEPAVLSLTLDQDSGEYQKGYQQINIPKVPGRYDEQLIDFAMQIKGEGAPAFSGDHDLLVHESLLKACEIIPVNSHK